MVRTGSSVRKGLGCFLMRWLKVALAGCASWLAMTAHAQADFVITPLAFALFAGPLGAVATFGGIYTGLQIAAYAAVLGAQLALSGGQQQKIDPGEMKNTFQEAETSEFNAVGRVKLGGLKAFGNTKGNVISRLIWKVKGPMVAVEQYFLGGREVTVEPDGSVSSPPWSFPGGSWANIKNKIGDGSETAWAELTADYPSLWTPAHLCRGIYQSLVRFSVPNFSTEEGNKKFQKLYQGGAPDEEEIARVAKIYDPRDPAQDPDDDSNWPWQDNGINVAVHIMRKYPDLTSADFDWDFLADEADRADALTATKAGTEERARCWGIWPSESKRGDVMQQVLDSIGAEVVLSDAGLIRIRLIDDQPTSEIAFPSRHIIELNWRSGPEAVERPNVCRIKYYSPERGYDMGEINMTGIAWARIDDEVTRYGEKIFDVELPFCPSPSQAQRIARRLFLQARADAGSVKTNMVGLAAWGVTYATIEDSDAEEMMLCRLAPPRIDDEQGQVDIPFIVWPQALIDTPWNPATMEANAPTPAPELQYESALATPAAPSEAGVVQYLSGAYETRMKYTSVVGATQTEAVYRTYTAGEPDPFESFEVAAGGLAYSPVNASSSKADFKVRFFNDDDEGSYYSPLLTVEPFAIDNTTPAAPSLGAGLDNETILVTATVSAPEMRATNILVESRSELAAGSGAYTAWTPRGQPEVRPGQPEIVTFTVFAVDDGKIQIRASTRVSNGTYGPYDTHEVTYHEPTP
jgi:hypothetical protein